jgi:hypothetical protein
MSKQLFMSIREQEVHADAQNGVFEDTDNETLHAYYNATEGQSNAVNVLNELFTDFGNIFSPKPTNSVTLNLNEERSI